MWSLKAFRCSHASETWWKLPNVKGPLETRSPVGLRRGEDQPEHRRHEEDREGGEDGETQAAEQERHQSSALKSPVRVMITTAPTSPIARRSTEIAAAALKSA